VKVLSVYLIAEYTFLARAPGKGFPGHLNVKRWKTLGSESTGGPPRLWIRWRNSSIRAFYSTNVCKSPTLFEKQDWPWLMGSGTTHFSLAPINWLLSVTQRNVKGYIW